MRARDVLKHYPSYWDLYEALKTSDKFDVDAFGNGTQFDFTPLDFREIYTAKLEPLEFPEKKRNKK